ncbi:MAG: LytR C-terminal domain-containing protein [Gemmatimonadetes bacterium]|nr:LytR C-terminal domain-containing protein [Gemmatimonadota bacterium]
MWLLGSLAGAFLLAASIWPRFQVEEAADPVVPITEPPQAAPVPDLFTRVSILNGCGDPGVAARMREKAQSLGFDVIEEGNADSFGYLETIVIDRDGDIEKARQVASLLGIPNYIQQISNDDYRLENIRIIVGKDYRKLQLLE